MIRLLYKRFVVAFPRSNNATGVACAQQTDQNAERRWAKRSSLTLRVNLYRGDDLVRHALATDFSLNGMFLRCHQADLKVGDELSLAIPDYQDRSEKWYPMRVKVARVAASGAGMSFYQHDSHLFCSVNKLLHTCCNQRYGEKPSSPFPHTHEAA
ncbi:MAG: PilZ domain-containing protein [Gammaproteobacteria bacterium]|nr:PilZ domain-containing protein [Gammaproteobacteria bacterium]